MGALWASQDVLKRKRLNRTAMLARLLGPMYDVDNSDVVQVDSKPIDGVALGTSVTAHYTAPATAGSVVQVHSLTLYNSHSAGLAVEIYLVPSGGSAGVPESIFRDTVLPGESVVMAPSGGWFLGPSGTIRAKAASANLVSMRGEVTEYAAQPDGVTLKVVDGVQLGTSYGTIYTAPASGLQHALLLNLTTCNTDSSDRAATLALVESGDTASQEDEIFGDTVIAKETFLDDTWRVLQASDFLQGKCPAAANVVAVRATVLEVA